MTIMGWLDKYWKWRTHRQVDFVIPMTVYEYLTYLENAKYIYVDVRAGGEIYLWYRNSYRDVDVEANVIVERRVDNSINVKRHISPTKNSRFGWKLFIYLPTIALVLFGFLDAEVAMFSAIFLIIAIIGIPNLARHRTNYLMVVLKRGMTSLPRPLIADC